MNINEAFDKYLEFLIIEKNLLNTTIQDYKEDFFVFLKYFPYIEDTNDLEKDDIDQFIYFQSIDEMKPTSIKRRVSTMKNFYIFLETEGIKKNINKKILTPKTDKKLREYLTIEEVDKLLKSFRKDEFKDIRDFAIIETMYSCGLRVSELVELKTKNINVTEKIIKVFGKGAKEREVPIRSEALKAILDYLSFLKKENIKVVDKSYLFISKNGKKLDRQYIWKMIKNKIKELEINKNISPHTLRHSFATHLISNGCELKVVQELLGHENIETTEIYTHIAEDRILNMYDNFWDKD